MSPWSAAGQGAIEARLIAYEPFPQTPRPLGQEALPTGAVGHDARLAGGPIALVEIEQHSLSVEFLDGFDEEHVAQRPLVQS